MRLLTAACAATVFCLSCATATATELLSLDDAYQKVLAAHPSVELSRLSAEGLRAQRDAAALKPAFTLSTELENAFGTGAAAALRGAEVTVSLASVIEQEEKRVARMALADERIDALDSRVAAQRLDIHAETARHYLTALAAKSELAIAQRAFDQAEALVKATKKRSDSGASPRSSYLAAQAAAVRVEGEMVRWGQLVNAAKRRLAALWGDPLAQFALPNMALRMPAESPGYEELRTLLARNPELTQFANRQRVEEAQLRLAQSERLNDLQWELGIRRLQAEDDWGLVGSVSLPLGTRSRALPQVRLAEAALASVSAERKSTFRTLEATLIEAWGELDAAKAEFAHTRDRLLPALALATESAQRYYRAGAGAYADWQRLQLEQVSAEREQLRTVLRAQRALLEIQRLTGESFAVTEPTHGAAQ